MSAAALSAITLARRSREIRIVVPFMSAAAAAPMCCCILLDQKDENTLPKWYAATKLPGAWYRTAAGAAHDCGNPSDACA
jgi:hypothetical protein